MISHYGSKAKGAGLADFIQPGLIQLQPNLDDFMDTLEPLQGNFLSTLNALKAKDYLDICRKVTRDLFLLCERREDKNSDQRVRSYFPVIYIIY